MSQMDRLKSWLSELRPHFVFWVILTIGGWLYERFHALPSIAYYAFAAGILATVLVEAGRLLLSRPQQPALRQENLGSQIRVLDKNSSMFIDIRNLIQSEGARIHRVLIVQYSGRNVRDIVSELWGKTSADIELYLGDPAGAINDHQKERIAEMLKKFHNELDPAARGNGKMELFTYSAPASVRAVLIDRRMLYLGTYFYKVMPVSDPELDTRGGELPVFAVPSEHPEFKVLADELENMVRNWNSNGKAQRVTLVHKATA